MTDVAAEITHVWKRFHRGEIHDSLRDFLPAVARRLFGRGVKSDELGHGDFWALQDVSFQVRRGEVLGIIGANGAGKSTLLKILARILKPTRGAVCVRGRLRALIEIAAGFHPDLTGRENIYLNGTILGMKRREIDRKFDEIVEFAGIPDALDTPVKRYSSGMYARLGFAVAAHLEPDILVVDEVLAVGDAQFQKRCLGKMRNVSGEGRTVLFVSHNMAAVRSLCQRAVLLEGGRVSAIGDVREVIARYCTPEENSGGFNSARRRHSSDVVKITDVRPRRDGVPVQRIDFGDPVEFVITAVCRQPLRASVELVLKDATEHPIAFLGSGITLGKEFLFPEGESTVTFSIPMASLAQGEYFVDVAVANTKRGFHEYLECCVSFLVEHSDPCNTGHPYVQGNGCVAIPFACASSAPEVAFR